jgi:hypothetical protein
MRIVLFLACAPFLAAQEARRSRLEFEPAVSPKPAGWDRSAAELSSALQRKDPGDLSPQLRAVASWDSGEAAEKLLSAFLRSVRQLESYDAHETRLTRRLDEIGMKFVAAYNRNPGSQDTLALARQYNAARQEYEALLDVIASQETAVEAILETLSRFRSAEAVAAIARQTQGAYSLRYRARLIETLGRNRTATALRGILDVLATKPRDVERLAATRALGALGEPAPEAAAALRESLSSEHRQVRTAAAEAIAALGIRELTEAILEALKNSRGRSAADLNEALKKLTGVDKHASYDAWKAWWDRHRDAFLAGTYQPEPLEKAGREGTTTFYGIPVVSDAVAFVLDVSGSMWQPASWKPPPDDGAPPGLRLTGDLKIHVLQYELKKTLLKLPEGATVCLIFFDSNLHLYGGGPVRLTASRRKSMTDFVDSVQQGTMTNLWAAMVKALSFAGDAQAPSLRKEGIDTIYVLTDGVPTMGVTEAPRFLNRFAALNRFTAVRVHAVQIGADPEARALLKPLAERTGGGHFER